MSIFLLCLGTDPSKTGEELVYHYLFHEEASFYLELHNQLFNRPFTIFKV